ncbi:MAG TPA: PAS domain-containing protein [Candidatus Sabulitectum sp.]|nr:PAS domain-containing protein [Candidatus Sabulitectum sp.]
MSEKHEMMALVEDSPFPWWSWDVKQNRVAFSRHKVENLGYRYQDFLGCGYEAFTNLLHPEDHERTMDAMRKVLSGASELYRIDYRILAADGSYHWYMDRGVVVKRLADGSPGLIRGLVLDLGTNLRSGIHKDELLRLFRMAVTIHGAEGQTLQVCSSCGSVRAGNTWLPATGDLADFLAAEKTHSVCEGCLKALYPDFAGEILKELGRAG